MRVLRLRVPEQKTNCAVDKDREDKNTGDKGKGEKIVMEQNPLVLSTSPHVKSSESVRKIMISVTVTLLPAVAFSIYQFGLYTLAMYAVSIAT